MVHVTFQRDKNTDSYYGDEVYLYHHSSQVDWRLAKGTNFRAKNTSCWMYLDSSGKKYNLDSYAVYLYDLH